MLLRVFGMPKLQACCRVLIPRHDVITFLLLGVLLLLLLLVMSKLELLLIMGLMLLILLLLMVLLSSLVAKKVPGADGKGVLSVARVANGDRNDALAVVVRSHASRAGDALPVRNAAVAVLGHFAQVVLTAEGGAADFENIVTSLTCIGRGLTNLSVVRSTQLVPARHSNLSRGRLSHS